MIARRALYIIIAVLAVALIGYVVVNKLRSGAVEATRDRVEVGQKGAATESAREAIKTQGDVSARERESEAIGRKNAEEIRGAEGAADKVNPGVRDAGFNSLCRRESFRRTARGRVQCPDPTGVGEGR